jgi:hypothetical protein
MVASLVSVAHDSWYETSQQLYAEVSILNVLAMLVSRQS